MAGGGGENGPVLFRRLIKMPLMRIAAQFNPEFMPNALVETPACGDFDGERSRVVHFRDLCHGFGL